MKDESTLHAEVRAPQSADIREQERIFDYLHREKLRRSESAEKHERRLENILHIVRNFILLKREVKNYSDNKLIEIFIVMLNIND